MLKHLTYLLLVTGTFLSCSKPSHEGSDVSQTDGTLRVLTDADIDWEKLNPARGDKSPLAGTLWGDRKGEVPTGFLAKFVDGFSSPPHIHNVTYRAVVIKGRIHNDDPNAKAMWMKPGSFWTQPEGESHITSAKGQECIALVEIDQGPYLVKPIEEAYDNGERPINIDVSNLVWLNNDQTNLVSDKSGAFMSFLTSGANGNRSLFVKLPGGYTGSIETHGSFTHAVVIRGKLDYKRTDTNEAQTLGAGGYFGVTGTSEHHIINNTSEEIVLYLRTNGKVIVH